MFFVPGRLVPFIGLLALIAAGLVYYSQTDAFAWDEGFHILTAQLILHGKKPYLDFCFSQTPLNALWNAGWMGLFGESWRVPHAVAALCSAGAMVLTSTYLLSRFPAEEWRYPAAVGAALLVGLNVLVVRFGGIAQAYGLCLVTLVAAFRCAVRSAGERGPACAAGAGFMSGIAAGSSLLTAPAGPLLLLWIIVYDRTGKRAAKAAAFAGGAAIAVLPILWLWVHGARQVIFGIIDYNLKYRLSDWPDAGQQNLEVLLGAVDSGPAVLLTLLAVLGLTVVIRKSDWDRSAKAEFYLCGWLSLGIFAYISNVRPTFERYYIFAVPFAAILAVAGLWALTKQVLRAERGWAVMMAISVVMAMGLAKDFYEEQDARQWADMEAIARKVNEVTKANETLYADEETYFASRHAPPSGMEEQNSHKLNFSAEDQSLYHVIPQPRLDAMVHAGYFHTLETCEDDDYIAEHQFAKVYGKSAEAGACTIFWEPRPAR